MWHIKIFEVFRVCFRGWKGKKICLLPLLSCSLSKSEWEEKMLRSRWCRTCCYGLLLNFCHWCLISSLLSQEWKWESSVPTAHLITCILTFGIWVGFPLPFQWAFPFGVGVCVNTFWLWQNLISISFVSERFMWSIPSITVLSDFCLYEILSPREWPHVKSCHWWHKLFLCIVDGLCCMQQWDWFSPPTPVSPVSSESTAGCLTFPFIIDSQVVSPNEVAKI